MNKIIIFDLETTGVNKSIDRIIQFAGKVYNKKDLENIKTFQDLSTIKPVDELNQMFKPDNGEKISLGAYSKHRICDDDLKEYPSFGEFADRIIEMFDNCDVATFNGMAFDIPMLTKELSRYNKKITWLGREFYDGYLNECKLLPHNQEETFKRYNKGYSMEEAGLKAHDANSDIDATLFILLSQRDRIDIQTKYVTDDGFLKISEFDGKDEIVFTSGKYYMLPVKFVVVMDRQYLNWILNSDFSDRTKTIIQKFIEKYSEK